MMNALAEIQRSKLNSRQNPSAAPTSAIWAMFRRLVAEPLVHFLTVGLVLVVAARLYEAQTQVYRIVVTPRHVVQLVRQYSLQFGVPPEARTLEALIRADVRDEMLYRHALAMNLQDGDEIVRRRLVQKMEFLLQDTHAPADPSPAKLRAHYQTHAAAYTIPPKATFSHVYFSEEGGGRGRAEALRARLSPSVTRAPEFGDPFPDLHDYAAAEPEIVRRLFGDTPFAAAVFEAPLGRWSGPYRSGYGWHLLRVSARAPAARAPFEAVEATVRADVQRAAQARANQAALADLERRFSVVRADLRP